MKEFFFIVNPASANGTTKTVWQEIVIYLKEKGLDFDYQLTTGPNQATVIAQTAIKNGYEKIVAVGGDGTVNEVVNGFFEENEIINPQVSLGVISRGTGCDLIRTLGIPKHYQGAVETLVEGNTKRIDLIKVKYYDEKLKDQSRYCINISDVGLGGFVAQRVNHTSKSGGGLWSYLRGTVLSILMYRANKGTVIVDGEPVHDGKFSIVAAANGKYFGGGMKLAPPAEIDDGFLNIIMLINMGKLELLYNLSKVYKGTHMGHPKIRHYKAKSVHVQSNEALPLEIDGENPGQGPVEYRILKKIVNVIC